MSCLETALDIFLKLIIQCITKNLFYVLAIGIAKRLWLANGITNAYWLAIAIANEQLTTQTSQKPLSIEYPVGNSYDDDNDTLPSSSKQQQKKGFIFYNVLPKNV